MSSPEGMEFFPILLNDIPRKEKALHMYLLNN